MKHSPKGADFQFRHVHSAVFEFEEDLTPALGRLAHAIFNGEKFLLTTAVYTNNNKGTKLVLLSTQTTVNAVRPDIDPLIVIQRFIPPAFIFSGPNAPSRQHALHAPVR
jgi:hypothetical protein